MPGKDPTESTREKREGKGETFGGVDYYGHAKEELYSRAKELRVEGRSHGQESAGPRDRSKTR